jgi:type IV fimbrial biogenesis protein FimT
VAVLNKQKGNSIVRHCRTRGLTLLELLVTLAVVTCILSLGVPRLDRLILSTQLETTSRELLGAIQLARSEAILRGTSVSMCPSPMWQTGDAICTGNYSEGWIVFSNPDRDGEIDTPSDEVIKVYAALREGYAVTNRLSTRHATERITYRADGASYRNLTLQVCPPGTDIPSISVILNIVGRARIERGWGECLPVT